MADVLIIVGFVIAIILLFASLMKMASREGDEMHENEHIEKCKICGKNPSIADVGGNNPYFEIICCCQSAGAKSKEGAILVWNEMQMEGGMENGKENQQ